MTAPVGLLSSWAIIDVIHYAYPSVVFLYFVAATTASICTLQTVSLKVKDQHVRRDILFWLMTTVVATYLVHACLLVVRPFIEKGWAATASEPVYTVACFVTFGLQVLALADTKFPVWYPYYGSWLTGILMETLLIILSNMYQPPKSGFDCVIIILQFLRICILIALPSFYLGLRNRGEKYENDDTERQSLLRKKLTPKRSSTDEDSAGYGATEDTDATAHATEDNSDVEDLVGDDYLKKRKEDQDRVAKRLKNDGNWWTYAKGFTVFFPYMWPSHSKSLQFRAVLVGCCLLTTNGLNFLIPRQFGIITDDLVDGQQPWLAVAVYAFLTFANSPSCVGWLQFWLWQPLDQYSYDAINTAAHAHVMNLSSDFHDNKDASDIHQAVRQGNSVTRLVETVCFQVIPMLIDLTIAIGYLFYLFGPYMALLTAVTAILYLYTTTKLVTMAASLRRSYIQHNRHEWLCSHYSIDNWRTASYFNNISYETQRYASSVKNNLLSQRKYYLASHLVGAAQGFVMTFGFLGGCWIAIYQLAHKQRSPGDLILFVAYWAQLRGPLSFFSRVYRDVSESMMDAERLLELFQTKSSILESKDAKPLKLVKGEVKFKQVHYAYDPRKPTLKNIDFTVPGGSTVALVGETGSGKSTILKLLIRFYDISSGSIEIDGQDIRQLGLGSLRDKIGVVPQDPALFHDSVMNNVRYARLSATDEEVYEACKAAAIHDKIMGFPDGYNSKVGSHGVKLSGGEKQRIAIARAILKKPEIILLDEATSAVDTETEQTIQVAFQDLSKGRTTFIVAHRLSTIMRADRIMVIKNGEIIEHGSHDDLIHSEGRYYDLWSKQILVKSPSKVRSRSRSTHKDDTDIVNDLNPERRTTDLAKVLRTTKHSEIRSHIEATSQNSQVPKLKANAPEFIPRHLRTDTDGMEPFSKVDSKEEQKQKSKKDKEQKKQEKDKKRQSEASKRGLKTIGKHVNKSGSNSETSQSATTLDGQGEDGVPPSGNEIKEEKSKSRRPRFGRRGQSKSEPASHLQESMDGTHDSDGTGLSSGEAHPLLGVSPTHAQNRRVSDPSGPPSSNPDMINSSTGNRFRRTRHWRIKNKVAENCVSGVSGTTFSSDPSTDYTNVPITPTTSPAEGFLTAAVRPNPDP